MKAAACAEPSVRSVVLAATLASVAYNTVAQMTQQRHWMNPSTWASVRPPTVESVGSIARTTKPVNPHLSALCLADVDLMATEAQARSANGFDCTASATRYGRRTADVPGRDLMPPRAPGARPAVLTMADPFVFVYDHWPHREALLL